MSGLLADLYSAGDRMKRKLGGLLSNPLETIALGSTRMAEDTNALTRLVSEAGYMPNTVNRADQSVLVSERQKALARALLADKGAEMGMAAATVWHGSPHKFDKFDSSKIGTGEGSQAYGHGLYLAENPTVARNYQEALAGGNVVDRMGKKISPSVGPESNALRALKDNNYDFDAAIGQLEKPITGSDKGWGMFASGAQEYRNQQVEFLKKLKADGAKFDSPGSLYKVDLPDNAIARMLDWDKPLSQQAPEVQQGVYQTLLNRGVPKSVAGHIVNNKSGRDALSTIGRGTYDARLLPPDGEAAAKTSEWLRQQGIPGVKYLDQGSRTTGEGSRNFVVFPKNEGLLQILERNGVPVR